MTAVDGDGIDEDLTRAVSVAMLAAARAGEQVARMTQAAAREREARAAGNTAEAQRQVEAHTEAAKAYFEVVTRPEYLSVATDEQIREVARQAEAWRERLPEAQRAAEATSHEWQERRPGQVDERPAVLAAEGEAYDRRASATEEVDVTHSVEQPPAGEADLVPEQSAWPAVVTARGVQGRLVSEVSGSGSGRMNRSSARQQHQRGS